jgi:CheY-like chemotaxis protein
VAHLDGPCGTGFARSGYSVRLPLPLRSSSGDAVGRTVLVVDDDDAVRELVAEVLMLAGYAVEQAADGLAALDAVARLRPDLVVSDLRMPGLDGAALARRLRRGRAPVPVVLLTAYDGASPVRGVQRLTKPFDLDDLLAAVAQALT